MDLGYTPEQINSIPGLNEYVSSILSIRNIPGGAKIAKAKSELASVFANPVSFINNQLQRSIYSGIGSGNYDLAKQQIAYLQSANVPTSTIQSTIESAKNNALNLYNRNQLSPQANDAWILSVGLAIALPGIGESLGQGLLASGALAAGTTAAQATAIGTAMASIAVQTAQGVPLEDAIKNAGVNAIVQTGSNAAATQLNEVIKNPAVTNALVSAGGSAVQTIAAGGSAEDITRNILGAVAGSATTSATGSNLAGSTVGGAVSGGVTGALTGAASALGQDAARDTSTTTPATTTSSSGPSGIQLAQADTGTVSDAGDGIFVGVSGTPIFADSPRAANVKAPIGFGVMPIEMADNQPAGSYFDYTQNAWIAPIADIQNLTSVSGTPSTSTPSSPPTVTSEGYTPTITTTPSPVVTPTTATTPTPVSADKPILDLIASTKPTTPVAPVTPTPVTSTPAPVTTPTTAPTTAGTTTPSTPVDTAAPAAPTTPVTQTTTQPPAAVSEQDKKMLDLISPPSTTTTETDSGVKVDISGYPKTDTPSDSGIKVDINGFPRTPTEPDQTLPEVVATATQDKEAPLPVDVAKEELPPEEVAADPTKPEDKYKPNLRIYGGTTPSTLSQSLGTGGTYSTGVATTGLTGSRGAGEIESKETGKKRKNVWNEASLRLKDALGV